MIEKNVAEKRSDLSVKLNTTLKQCKKHYQLLLFMILPLLYIIIFAYGPMMGLQIAFKDFDAFYGIWESPWVGFEHFTKFMKSYQFTRVLKNTLVISVYSLVARFPIPIILALCVNAMQNRRFKMVSQTIFYIPHFISVVVLVGMINQFFNPYVGLYGNIYKALFSQNAPELMTNPSSFLHMYVWSGIWQNMGWDSIIYLAALSSVSPDLHEAAQIDGASRFKRVIHIDFPAVVPTIVLLLIINVGHVMNLGFEKIYLMQNDINIKLSEVISTYVYKVGMSPSGGNYSYATAIGMFNSVINFVLVVTVNHIAKKYGETSLF